MRTVLILGVSRSSLYRGEDFNRTGGKRGSDDNDHTNDILSKRQAFQQENSLEEG
jgi:hypothetical protein